MTIITVALITTKWQLDLVIVNLSHLEIFRNHKFPEYCLSIYVKLCTAFTFVYKWFVLYIHIINARFSTVYYVAKKNILFLKLPEKNFLLRRGQEKNNLSSTGNEKNFMSRGKIPAPPWLSNGCSLTDKKTMNF